MNHVVICDARTYLESPEKRYRDVVDIVVQLAKKPLAIIVATVACAESQCCVRFQLSSLGDAAGLMQVRFERLCSMDSSLLQLSYS